MVSDITQTSEDASEQHFWGAVLRMLWTALIGLLLSGVLASLIVVLDWQPYLLLCLIGVVTGASLSIAFAGSARSRELTALVLGGITLPALAAWLGTMSVTGDAAFRASSTSLTPFVVHAATAALGGLWIARVWRRAPAVPEREDAAAPARTPAAGGG